MTTNKITESAIEEFAIDLLEKQGYQYIYAPDIAPDSETPERSSFEDVLLLERLKKSSWQDQFQHSGRCEGRRRQTDTKSPPKNKVAKFIR